MTFDVEQQQVVVAGAGRSGRAAAELLVDRGARVTLADTATAVEDMAALERRGVALALGDHAPDLFRRADLLVLSPGVSPAHPAVAAAREAGVPVIGEVELASRWLRGRVIAITGTKGKSTTTTLVARILAEAGMRVTAGGNLGVALSAQVGASTADTLHVVEVSSFQLETTETFHPWVAVLLNMFPDHLDRHGSFDAYREAKARILANQTREDWAVINLDDPEAIDMARRCRARRFDFGLDSAPTEGITVESDTIVRRTARGAERLVPVGSVCVRGQDLLRDVLAAVAVACIAEVSADVIRRAVAAFDGLEHALEWVADHRGVTYINDSKATNVDAAIRSIETVGAGVVPILGGRSKGARFDRLRVAVGRHARGVVAIGEAAGEIREALKDTVPVVDAMTLRGAVDVASRLARPSGTVLLAPACASFDQFRDYAERGREFKAAVRRLVAADVTPPAGATADGRESDES